MEPTPQSPSVPLEPPADAEAVTADRTVLKAVLQAGTGAKPSLHARCLVHYVGRLLPSGEVFMDTRSDSQAQEPVKLVAGRSSVTREAGLHLAVAAMAAGERAAVYVLDPALGFGAAGSFSFPAVPPHAQLVYEVHLLDWEPVEEGEERGPGGLLYEERLEAAERRRRDGNTLFAAGDYAGALGKYSLALSYVDEDFLLQLEGRHWDQAQGVVAPIQLNMAAAQLKLGDYATASWNCTQVITHHPDNAKALFRRSKARSALGQTEQALADAEAALKLEPGDKAVLREVHALKQALREERRATSKLFKGAFGAPPKPRPEGANGGDGGGGGGGASMEGGWLQGLLDAVRGLLLWLAGLFGLQRRPERRAEPTKVQ